jgi:hypothetical protein
MATPPRKSAAPKAGTLRTQKWLTLVALPPLLVTTYFGIYSLWGILFIYWGMTSVRAGKVYLVEPIDRTQDPVLFWIISVMWIGFGALYVVTDFFPSLLV